LGTGGVDGGEAFVGVEIGGIELANFEVIEFGAGVIFGEGGLVGAFGEGGDFGFFGAGGEGEKEGENEEKRGGFHVSERDEFGNENGK